MRCRDRYSRTLILTAILCATSCQPAGVSGPPRASRQVAAPWYERVDNTRQDPERVMAGEPDVYLAARWTHPLSREQSLEMLLRTERFCALAVGVGGSTPRQAYAFKTILNQPDAAAAFESLVRRGSPAGQLYGLLGLYLTDRDTFTRRVPPYRTNVEQVQFFAGCNVSRMPVNSFVDGIEDGGWPTAYSEVPDRPPVVPARAESTSNAPYKRNAE